MTGSVATVGILDSGGTPRNVRAFQNSDLTFSFMNNIEQAGAPLGTANGLPTTTAGSMGTDASSNAGGVAASVIGATVGTSVLGGTGPFAAYILVGSVPANTARAGIYVENISGQQILCVRDDGTAAAGAAPANASWFLLGAGAGVPSQGGSWQSLTFKGRMQLWAVSDPGPTARPTIMQD